MSRYWTHPPDTTRNAGFEEIDLVHSTRVGAAIKQSVGRKVMSEQSVISVEHLGKRYRIRHQQQGGMRYKALRDVLADGTKSVARRLWSLTSVLRPSSDPSSRSPVVSGPRTEDFWALKDVSFDVKQGETLGIIGRNGAGKSTLLKILSRITEPTEGRVRLKGRVASLLEVGTGFHPELTGRENIFLNGAILGMTRAEIKNKFDEIVAFAEVDKFLDTPVKRYSSGMYVRLAFAVAAHLEPEILIVDEVLAVGDAQFQKKCLGKMSEVASRGRTVLFVSHNMSAIARLCQRCLLLDQGKVVADLGSAEAVAQYLGMSASQGAAQIALSDHTDRSGDGTARILEATLQNAAGNFTTCFSVGDAILVEYLVEYKKESPQFSHSIEITNSDGIPVYHLWDMDSRTAELSAAKRRIVQARIGAADLCPDRYFVTLWAGDTQGNRADRIVDCLSFTIEQANARTSRPLHKSKALVYKLAEWTYRDV